MGSFTQKQLRATLTLPAENQTFAGTNSNQLVLSGFRMSASLQAAGNYTNFCDLTIYGMRQQDMNAVTVLWAGPSPTAVNARALLVLEANDSSGWLQVFEGQFVQAAPDYRAAPDASLSIYAATGYGAQLATAPPISYAGGADVATIARTLATGMGFAFENNGVQAQLHTPYYAGTAMDQFRSLCADANIDYYFDANGTLIICPKNQPRIGKSAVQLNPGSGLIGFPTIQQFGVNVQCLFTPAIALASEIEISNSGVPGADGRWFPQKAVHQLESMKPGGQWASSLDCYPFSAVAPS